MRRLANTIFDALFGAFLEDCRDIAPVKRQKLIGLMVFLVMGGLAALWINLMSGV
jgi:hypothetical protein